MRIKPVRAGRLIGLLVRRFLSSRDADTPAASLDEPHVALISAPQMETLGRVTGGVAHDFNNLLTVVLGNAAALRTSAEARGDDQAIRRAELIERAAKRGSHLAGQLLAFSGKQMLLPQVVCAYNVVSHAQHLLAGAVGETIRIILTAERDLWRCRVDPTQLESAILNLVLNARDAMSDGGKITIHFRNLKVIPDPRKAPWRTAGDYVNIDVQDNGIGIPPDLLGKVFEPFFTTKPIGQGSGLGLAQVHGFARQSGGWVELASVVGRGTTVSLFLPVVHGSDSTRNQATISMPSGNRNTVLVAEPNPDLRQMSSGALTAAGFATLEATTCSGAITHLVSDAKICLLLAADRLPGGISGAELGRHARLLRPDLRVLVTENRVQDSLPQSRPFSAADGTICDFLAKPYRAEDLVSVVKAALLANTVSAEAEELLTDNQAVEFLGRGVRRSTSPTRLVPPSSNAPPETPQSTVRSNTIRLGIMPFVMTGSRDKDFCAGLAEEISTAVAAFRMITCIAPASLAAVASEPLDQTDRWRQLDLDFLVEGSLRRKGEDFHVMVRLLRMGGTGEIAWMRRFGGKMSDVLNLQDRIAHAIAAQLVPQIVDWEGREAAARPQVNVTAYDLMLRAIPAVYSLDQAGFAEAGLLLERSLALDPSSAGCHAWLAHWHLLKLGQGREPEPTRAIERANHLSQRAIALDPGDARGLTVAGHIRAFLHRDAAGGLSLHERALALNPCLALAWCYSGLAHSYLGNHAEAIRSIQRARELSPHDPHYFFFDMALVVPYLMSGDYETAARHGRRARDAHPGLSSTYKGLLPALGLLGQKHEAAAVRRALLNLEPHFSIESAIARSPLLRPEDLECYVEGLRRAGVPKRSNVNALVTS